LPSLPLPRHQRTLRLLRCLVKRATSATLRHEFEPLLRTDDTSPALVLHYALSKMTGKTGTKIGIKIKRH
jgi:hypothetical protein